jgi:hypothetical protein
MNAALQAAIARANAQIARAQDWIDLRLSLYRRVNELPNDDLVRLARVVAKLTPDELDAALGYAEGLAAWSSNEPQSADGTPASDRA